MTDLTHILMDPAHWVAEGIMDLAFTALMAIPAYFLGKRRVKAHDKKIHGKDS